MYSKEVRAKDKKLMIQRTNLESEKLFTKLKNLEFKKVSNQKKIHNFANYSQIQKKKLHIKKRS